MDNNQYNDEPVCYCKRCLSLRIMRLFDTTDTCYCDKCGNTDIGETHIEMWKIMYRGRYGRDF